MKLSFRTIGKLGFLLVIIGFFMPMFNFEHILFSLQVNGFEYAELARELGGDSTIYGIFMYGFFIFAIMGLIIGILLLVKKSIPVLIDWLITLVCVAGILFFSIDSVKDGAKIQTGVYIIVLGLLVALIAQIISFITESSKIDNKPHHPHENILNIIQKESIKADSEQEAKNKFLNVGINRFLGMTSITFAISILLLSIFVNSNPIKIAVSFVLLVLMITAETYGRLVEEK
jgi:cobalamin biosynthesis protein CobD/CbiB